MIKRILDKLDLGPPVCADCDVELAEVDEQTGRRRGRGRRHYQRCRPCWFAMVQRWEAADGTGLKCL